MLIKEYRLVLPFTLEEFQRGQLWSVAEASKNETGGGNGVVIVKQHEFRSKSIRPGHTIEGVYTYKIYYLAQKVPYVFRKLFPETAFILHEESWNAFPYTKTVLTNPDYMKGNFKIVVETIHCEDRGEQSNALNLPKDVLKKREVVFIDIADDSNLKKGDFNDENNIHQFTSEKTGRGPLNEGWARKHKPVITAYKCVSVNFKWFGLQNRVEKAIHKTYPRLFAKFHRECFCWIDQWYALSMEEIRSIEEETQAKLKQAIDQGECKGMAEEGSDNKKSSSSDEEEK
uniref:Phosphatidylinositol transfer protein n=1 Tax=Panagrellus redivivus TaxID=6233 RepID=A0A7E4VPV7_PANRE